MSATIDIPWDTVLGLILAISIAVSGVKDAMNQNETVDWVIFWKTIFVAMVTAGLLEAAKADMAIKIVGTPIFTELLDKLLNALLNKFARTRPILNT